MRSENAILEMEGSLRLLFSNDLKQTGLALLLAVRVLFPDGELFPIGAGAGAKLL